MASRNLLRFLVIVSMLATAAGQATEDHGADPVESPTEAPLASSVSPEATPSTPEEKEENSAGMPEVKLPHKLQEQVKELLGKVAPDASFISYETPSASEERKTSEELVLKPGTKITADVDLRRGKLISQALKEYETAKLGLIDHISDEGRNPKEIDAIAKRKELEETKRLQLEKVRQVLIAHFFHEPKKSFAPWAELTGSGRGKTFSFFDKKNRYVVRITFAEPDVIVEIVADSEK